MEEDSNGQQVTQYDRFGRPLPKMKVKKVEKTVKRKSIDFKPIKQANYVKGSKSKKELADEEAERNKKDHLKDIPFTKGQKDKKKDQSPD